jgi:fermentation-respiration switch protein FrsA (DUF1100 family)
MKKFVYARAVAASLVMIASVSITPLAGALTVPSEYATTPVADEFYTLPAGYEATQPGTVLKFRSVEIANLSDTPTTNYQLLVRTTDSHGQPTATVSTLLTPNSPWTGAGERPVMDYSMAEDSLGAHCAPSIELSQGKAGERDFAQYALKKGYAFLTTDHEGPNGAYAAGRLAGQAVLDGIRGAKQFAPSGVTDSSPIIVAGYSGGAIAAGWAAQLAPTYAPDVQLKGAIIGGTPADMQKVATQMNGSIGSSYFIAAALGVAREYPELYGKLNALGRQTARDFKDHCKQDLTNLGLLSIPLEFLTSIDVLRQPDVQAIFKDVSLGAQTPRIPVYMWHGQVDTFMPLDGAKALSQTWCKAGAKVSFTSVFGGHAVGEMTGRADALTQATNFLEGDGQLIKPACN